MFNHFFCLAPLREFFSFSPVTILQEFYNEGTTRDYMTKEETNTKTDGYRHKILDLYAGSRYPFIMTELLIQWPDLTKATLIRRYKRFMVDVQLESGEVITAHCPNSGSMRSCLEPGRRVFLSHSPNEKRKFAHTFEIIEMPSSLVVVNTLMANRIVKEAIQAEIIPELSSYTGIRAEVPYGRNSRIDLLLEGREKPCLVEVKSCTLAQDGIVMFPDCVTERGLKHLVELQREAGEGKRCMMFFLIQRMDGKLFRPADHIDPAYGRELRDAFSSGVEIIAYTTHITLTGVGIAEKIPVDLS